MKKVILLSSALILAMVVLGVSCGGTGSSNQSTMDHNSMNHNAMNHNAMNSNMPTNHNSMNHSEMKSDANAASAPFDLQFIDTMSHHHDGAIRMAETALKNSQNEELKKFAQKIIDDQKKENAAMKEWREKWFPGKPPAKNMEMPGMTDSMKMMAGDEMKKMETAAGKEFDLLFLDMMIPHHQGAVLMAREALQKSEKAEIKTLANEIIKAQEAEIKQMTDWKAKLNK